MSGVNKVIVLGRLGADPEVKTINNGNTVATASVATSDVWTDKEGNKQEKTEWHRLVFWGKTAENVGKYFKKGDPIYIEGKLQTRSWEDDKGVKRYVTEIVAQRFDFAGKSSGQSNRPPHPADQGAEQDYGPEPSFDPNEDIPL